MEISEVLGIENGHIKLNPLFIFEETYTDNINSSDKVVGSLKRTSNSLVNKQKLWNSEIFEEI